MPRLLSPVVLLTLGLCSLGTGTKVCSAQQPQPRPFAETGQSERQVAFVEFVSAGPAARVELAYGSPAWREQYTAYLDSRLDRHLRLGRGPWSTWMSSRTAVFHAGDESVRIPPGVYGLGLRRTGNDELFLTFTRLESLVTLGIDPGRTRDVAEHHRVLLRRESIDRPRDRLEIAFESRTEPGDTPATESSAVPLHSASADVVLRWHEIGLRATFTLLDERPATQRLERPWFEPRPGDEAGTWRADEDAALYRTERAGDARPSGIPADARYEFSYTLWSEDGRPLDSAHARSDTATGTLDRVLPSWRPVFERFGPGARVRVWDGERTAVIDLLGIDW
jgi:hypothetical protein